MIAIFNTESEAIAYSNKIHQYLLSYRPGYSALAWSPPIISADSNKWMVKTPIEWEDNRWGTPLDLSQELSTAAGQTVPLPEIGELCEIDKYYLYKGSVLLCRQTHNRTIYEPKDTPALFSFHRDNTSQLKWGPNEQVEVGWERVYNDIKYRCITAHMTQADWTPDITPALWTPLTGTRPIADWVQPTGAHDAYNIGDMVYFEGSVYQSIINGNVWSPTVYPAGWTKLYDL